MTPNLPMPNTFLWNLHDQNPLFQLDTDTGLRHTLSKTDQYFLHYTPNQFNTSTTVEGSNTGMYISPLTNFIYCI